MKVVANEEPGLAANDGRRDIVVVGASAGGVEALSTLAAGLPPDLAAAVIVVIHLAPGRVSLLDRLLSQAGPLPVAFARDREPLRHGAITLACPDRHLLINNGELRLTRGPRENGARPAIDVTFRSAAISAGSRVIGVLLTGRLGDGAAGLAAIARCGGRVIVQHPDDAVYPDMPRNALGRVQADQVLPLAGIAPALARLTREPAGPGVAVPPDLVLEARLAGTGIEPLAVTAQSAPYVCPQCGGALWRMGEEEAWRFRCHTGHAFSAEALLDGQADAVEKGLYAALRALREREHLLRRLAADADRNGRDRSRDIYRQRLLEASTDAGHIEALLLTGSPAPHSR